MLSEDVILITINYRLGVLGFMSTGDKSLPGNLGLKDQVLALKWVHDNIEYFGGNPHNVSIWGQSAGGVSVSLHMISQKSRKYFSTAVAISGTSFQHWSVLSRKKSRDLADSLASRFGCFRKDSRALLKCMQAVNADMLVAAQIWLYVSHLNQSHTHSKLEYWTIVHFFAGMVPLSTCDNGTNCGSRPSRCLPNGYTRGSVFSWECFKETVHNGHDKR